MRHGTTKMACILLTAVVAAVLVAVAGSPGSASAAQAPCQTTAAFSQFGDAQPYSLMIGGAVEAGFSGFQSSGKPTIVAGNETYYLHSSTDQHSLQLATGDSARFHAGCIGMVVPSLRFVARSVGSPHGTLSMQVAYQDSADVTQVVDLGKLDAGSYSDWTPTPVLSFLDSTTSWNKQAGGNVWLILRPDGAAKWQVDDLYIDPYHSK